MANEIKSNFEEKYGLDAYLRVRVSKGYTISSIMGNYNFKCNDLLVLPHIGQYVFNQK